MSADAQRTGSEVVLEVEQVGKEYKLYDAPKDRLHALLTGRSTHRSHWALRDVSFKLHRGQCMGVIGDNGAGKSSLLKLIVGTLQPTEGRLTRAGRVTAILELGAGFHPEFSGRENLYFGGSLIGISHSEMSRLEAEILEFSELGEAIDRPVKTYSSGMAVRLAFALVTAVEPDLLIIDEALAVGDQNFQKKCVQRIDAFRRNGCTILFCSHSLYHIRHLCNVALWLDRGQVKAFGETEAVLPSYEAHVRAQDPSSVEAVEAADAEVSRISTTSDTPAPPPDITPEGSIAKLVSVEVAHLGSGTPPLLESRDLVVTVTARLESDEQPSIAVMLQQSHGVGITAVATHTEGIAPTCLAPGLWTTTLTFPELPLHSGDYVVSAYLFDTPGLVVYDEWLRCVEFKLVSPSRLPGLVRLPHRWS
ncbi:MAG: ABC transporter ATP-binding protein [Pseudomonadota bacterium]|nr:ABC transporter ATP-binding protein [Pseudomonadota bacterium]